MRAPTAKIVKSNPNPSHRNIPQNKLKDSSFKSQWQHHCLWFYRENPRKLSILVSWNHFENWLYTQECATVLSSYNKTVLPSYNKTVLARYNTTIIQQRCPMAALTGPTWQILNLYNTRQLGSTQQWIQSKWTSWGQGRTEVVTKWSSASRNSIDAQHLYILA